MLLFFISNQQPVIKIMLENNYIWLLWDKCYPFFLVKTYIPGWYSSTGLKHLGLMMYFIMSLTLRLDNFVSSSCHQRVLGVWLKNLDVQIQSKMPNAILVLQRVSNSSPNISKTKYLWFLSPSTPQLLHQRRQLVSLRHTTPLSNPTWIQDTFDWLSSGSFKWEITPESEALGCPEKPPGYFLHDTALFGSVQEVPTPRRTLTFQKVIVITMSR